MYRLPAGQHCRAPVKGGTIPYAIFPITRGGSGGSGAETIRGRWGNHPATAEGKLSFDDLLQRIHPAASRVAKLSRDHPAQLVLFDLLVDERRRSHLENPFSERRAVLASFAAKFLARKPTFLLSPSTPDISMAQQWLKSMRGRLDGLVAKRIDLPIDPVSAPMQKIKNLRTADCVVGGFRYLAKKKLVGSLLLGLYDRDGLLHHVWLHIILE